MISPQREAVTNLLSGDQKVKAKDINIFNVLTNKIQRIVDNNLGRDNIKVYLPQSYSTKVHSPHHAAALSHNYNNKYKCFSQQNSNSKKIAPKKYYNEVCRSPTQLQHYRPIVGKH